MHLQQRKLYCRVRVFSYGVDMSFGHTELLIYRTWIRPNMGLTTCQLVLLDVYDLIAPYAEELG
jgi:hypothetical protein